MFCSARAPTPPFTMEYKKLKKKPPPLKNEGGGGGGGGAGGGVGGAFCRRLGGRENRNLFYLIKRVGELSNYLDGAKTISN